MPITAFDHVNIRTANLNAMTKWYEEILGLTSGPRPDFGFPGAWMYLGEHPVVHLVETATPPLAGGDVTLEHAAFRATDLTAFMEVLAARNVAHKAARIDSIGLTQINIWDPDGNHIHVDFKDTSPP